MSGVRFGISMSLDGFITGPDDRIGQGLGKGGERLHEWIYPLANWRERHGREGGETNVSSQAMDEFFMNTGAIIMGKRMFTIAEEPWGENPPFHAPVFVVTHEEREPLTKSDTTFNFVTGGIEDALAQAKAAAGDKDVSVAGGANVAQQFLKAGLLDEVQISIVPVLMGDGVPLFDGFGPEQLELEIGRVIAADDVTHIQYRRA